MPRSNSGPMMESNHAYQQPHYSPEEYVDTRVAQPEHFREAVSYITDDIEDGEEANILVLGCNCGKNDLLPLIDNLNEHKNGSYSVTAIDDANNGAIEEAVDRLKDKGVSLIENKAGKLWTVEDNGLSVTLLKEDIETYPSRIFEGNYDVILSFFVFNHLTNWQLCVHRLCETLGEGGRLYITRYDDPVTRGLEDNPTPDEGADDLINLFYKYHQCRLDKHGVIYSSNLLGTEIEFLEEALVGEFDKEVVCDIEYEFHTSKEDVIRRLKPNSLHTPIYWGGNPEGGGNNFEECIPSCDTIDNPLRKYSGTLSLHQFTKTKDSCSLRPYIWDSNLRSILGEIDDKIEISPEEQESNTVEEHLTILMQLILGYQGFSRNTQFFTPLFWEVNVDDEVDIDLDSSPFTWRTLITSRNLSNAFNRYLNHLILFRGHDVGDRRKERYSLAEVIFSRSKSDINWVFAPTEKEFSCESIRNGALRFFVIKIPGKYRSDARDVDESIVTQGVGMHKLNNFTCYDLREMLENANTEDYERVQDLVEGKILDQDSIDFESDLRVQNIREAFRNPMWDHLEDNQKHNLASTLAERVPRFAYLVQLGACVYITNKLYENGGVTGSGGFFFCERDVTVEELKDQTSFLSQRYRLLKDVVNAYSRKTVLPHVEATRSRRGQWKEVGLKTLHNTISDIAAAQKVIEEYLRKNDAEELQEARTILSEYHRRSQSIFTFQKRKENGEKDYTEIQSLEDHIEHELGNILHSIEHIGVGGPKRTSGFIECLNEEEFKEWVTTEGAERPIHVEKSFTSGLREVLKNSLENTDPEFGVQINIAYSQDRVKVVIENSKAIPEKVLRFVRSYPQASSEDLDVGFGLVISMDIMEYCSAGFQVDVTDIGHTNTKIDIPIRDE